MMNMRSCFLILCFIIEVATKYKCMILKYLNISINIYLHRYFINTCLLSVTFSLKLLYT